MHDISILVLGEKCILRFSVLLLQKELLVPIGQEGTSAQKFI